MTRWMVWIALILKRVFVVLVKKKGVWSFWGKQRKDEIWNIKNEIIRV